MYFQEWIAMTQKIIKFNCGGLVCPLCGAALEQTGGSLVCSGHHTYDIARQGYVNLLPVQQKHSLAPGDTSAMLTARRTFLDGNFYARICADVADELRHIPGGVSSVVDVGCGEGYYTAAFQKLFPDALVTGADISKDAVRMAASRAKTIRWITATAFTALRGGIRQNSPSGRKSDRGDSRHTSFD